MANTEGMSDDFVASLGMVTGGDSSSNTSSSETMAKASRTRQDWLMNERMELPMGTTPAAKVMRASPDNHRNMNKDSVEKVVEKVVERKQKPAITEAETVDTTATPSATSSRIMSTRMPLVGDIVEHQPTCSKNSNNPSSIKPKVSRFAQRRQQQHQHPTGFPSVHVPLGTFVKPKKSVNKTKPRMAVAIAAAKDSIALGSSSDAQSAHALNDDKGDILQASRKDAHQMLSGMSPEEIRQAQQELQDAISPEMIAFLKQRGKKKKPSVKVEAESSKKVSVSAIQARNAQQPASNKGRSTATDKESENELAEKQRIARLIASVKTHEDLDAAFLAEMKQAHPLDSATITSENHQVDETQWNDSDAKSFKMACDLLRSTSPRQALWAAKIVSVKLETLAKDPYSTKTAESRQSLPDVLSVSLRCLLDKPVSSTYLLQTYALQSLYYLTIIYAHPAHVVLITNDTTDGNTDSRIFQYQFLDDAIPTPPLDVAYPPLSVKPLSIDESTQGSAGKAPSTPAAYAAGSSTTSALKDGQDFRIDPMWTLLSRMKIIPRLAFLLQHHQALMPVEAWVAICGLLCMVGQRSPGAASAIVQHDSLVTCLVHRTLEHLQSGSNTSASDKTANVEMIPYSVMTLFCTLARQSKVAAEGIPLEDILPPLLASHALSQTEYSTQQSALILWRTVMRYGLGLEALASMLAISTRHLALPYSNKFSLSTEFLSAFSQVLECLRVFNSKNNDDFLDSKISPNSSSVLDTAATYMASTTRTILPQSATTPVYDDEPANLAMRLRYNGSRLMYLSSWFHLFDSTINNSEGTLPLSLGDFFSSCDIESITSALAAWASPGGDVERSWRLVSVSSSDGKKYDDVEVEAAATPSAANLAEGQEDQLLPLGKLWLWKTLSGSVQVRVGGVFNATKEATDVIANVMQLLLEEEEAEDVMNIQGYCSVQSMGARLYYLMNVCLQSEQILSDYCISDAAEAILDRYLRVFGKVDSDVLDFCNECSLHSTPTMKTNSAEEEDSDETKLSDQEALEKFVLSEGESIYTSRIPVKDLRSLEVFIEDITTSYREYGAQFDVCTKCVRAFLHPAFPSSIRCRVLQELDGMHHVLTLPKEAKDVSEIAKLLAINISGGLSAVDGTAPDNADILNKAAEIL
ncbi:MAG: hypothetical protein SGILL_002572, partial [Bacillariaceae sp.]